MGFNSGFKGLICYVYKIVKSDQAACYLALVFSGFYPFIRDLI